MKCKMLVLILALTVASWAQTATQPVPSTTQQSTVRRTMRNPVTRRPRQMQKMLLPAVPIMT